MAEQYTAEEFLQVAREGLRDIGYQDELLRTTYQFADMFARNQPLRTIALAAFAQEPPSYRNACIGIAIPSQQGSAAIAKYKALGAPQILALHPTDEKIFRWKILAQGQPELLETIEATYLRNVIQAHRAEWNPEHILRAKSIRFSGASVQLDFYDTGLIPALEIHVYDKLDRLLRDTLAICKAIYQEHHNTEPDYKAVFRLIFRLVAAKLLGDRQYPGNWLSSNAQEVIASVEHFYFQHMPQEAVLHDERVQNRAWENIRTAFSFQNLSVEALASIYENTLVTPETRKALGTHATNHFIAEYIVQQLPFEDVAPEERYVFEPFSGHAPFLVASLERLRSLLPTDMPIDVRHDYFVQMLTGMDYDAFACEVAWYSLILTDYPNPNGWRIENTNTFENISAFDAALKQARFVLCNPPYEDITFEERKTYRSILTTNKAVEALRRVLLHSPKMLGFVLPRKFLDGQLFREVRKTIADTYNTISLVALPDNAFHFSEVETVLLIAHGERTTQPTWSSAFVTKDELQQFLDTGKATWQAEAPANFIQQQLTFDNVNLWYNPLQQLWDTLSDLPRLGEIAEIHRGIEYKVPFKENIVDLVSDVPRPGFSPGLARVTESFEPYVTKNFVYLNTDKNIQLYEAYKLPWEKPKILVNAARLSRGPWTISAIIDEQGLIAYQNFHGIWPTGNVPLEVIAAVLNGPIANAFLSSHQTSRHNQLKTINQTPFPRLNPKQTHLIVMLVREYMDFREKWRTQVENADYYRNRCRGTMRRLEGELLTAYNLPLHLERELVKYFDGVQRPGPVSLSQVDLSPTKRFYTAIIRIEKVREENDNKIVDAVITSWDPYQTVHLPVSIIPEHLQEKLEPDRFLLASVNIGARQAKDLFFEDIELAPEPKTREYD
jgi:N-6 DNA Methylase